MWLNPQEAVDLVTFTGEFIKVKLHFLCSDDKRRVVWLLQIKWIAKTFNEYLRSLVEYLNLNTLKEGFTMVRPSYTSHDNLDNILLK